METGLFGLLVDRDERLPEEIQVRALPCAQTIGLLLDRMLLRSEALPELLDHLRLHGA